MRKFQTAAAAGAAADAGIAVSSSNEAAAQELTAGASEAGGERWVGKGGVIAGDRGRLPGEGGPSRR